jgi:hypothetical protein
MTTITIQNGKKLSKTVFQTFDELMDEYYATEKCVILREVKFEDLPPSSQKSIEESEKMGINNLIDFRE